MDLFGAMASGLVGMALALAIFGMVDRRYYGKDVLADAQVVALAGFVLGATLWSMLR